MKEIIFLNRNIERWRKFETILDSSRDSKPDNLADLFIQLTDDLSYAKTNYSKSKTTQYLNSLALRAHLSIYKNRKETTNRFITFWKYELPIVVYENRKNMGYAFLIFFVSALIGVMSSAYDDSFVRLILGDAYVNMTLENIRKGDPLAVYKHAKQIDMFLGITFNNISVSFWAFVLGVVFSIGSAYILFSNGIMLGSFQYLFFKYNLLYQSVLTIWIHGTLEIFAIIMSGAAGMAIGNSILFPGTFSRLVSFKMGVKKGIKVVFGLVPVFIIAAFLEGYITRYTNAPDYIRLGIICFSLIFIGWYFFIYPYKLYQTFNT